MVIKRLLLVAFRHGITFSSHCDENVMSWRKQPWMDVKDSPHKASTVESVSMPWSHNELFATVIKARYNQTDKWIFLQIVPVGGMCAFNPLNLGRDCNISNLYDFRTHFGLCFSISCEIDHSWMLWELMYINIGFDDVYLPSNSKSLSEPILTKFYDPISCHQYRC